MRRGSGSSLARAQSGIPTGSSGDGTATLGGAGSFSFNPSGAPSSATATAFPSFSFSSTPPSSSSSSAALPAFSFAPSATASQASPSSAPPPASSFTFPGHNPQPQPHEAQPQQRQVQIGPPSPYAHAAPGGSSSPAAAASGAEQPWEPTFKREHKDESPAGNLLRSTTAILNKIGPRNFDSMVRELAEHVTGRCVHDGRQGVCGNGIAGVQQLEMFSRIIFEKALEEPNFSDIYAHVCRAISPLCPRFDDATFEFFMSSMCDGEVVDYLEFEDDEEDTDDEGDDGEDDGEAAQLKQQILERKAEFRRRLLGNLKFASELYNCGMLSTGDLLDMVDYVVDHAELCCYFMRHAGRMLDFRTDDAVEHGRVQPPFYTSREEANDAKPYIDSIYARLAKNLEDHKLPTRISFMIQDLLEERNNHWEKVPPSAPQPAAEDPPRRPPITVRRSLAGKPPGPAAAAASPPTSRAAHAAAAASASPARPANAPTQPQSPQSPAQARAPAAATTTATATATATMESKREQVRLIAGSIVRSLKEALQWADDNERRMDAQPGMRTAARVEELNRAFLIRVSEALERMQRQHGEVPFLQNLIAVIAAYARDTTKIGGERGPYQPANIARLKGTLADRVAQVEQVINQSSSAQPAGATSARPVAAAPTAAGATTGHQQPPPLAAASALAPSAMGAGPPREVQRAPAHAPAPAPAPTELAPGWVDPDLHQLTAGQPLDRLLRRWEEELVAKAADLDRRAKAVASFDRVCVGLDRSMAELVTHIDQVTIAQTEVDQGLDLILRHQESFYAILCNLQEEAEATLTEGDADRQRERSYDSAKEVDRELHDVELTLKGLVEDFNSQLVQRRTTQEQKVVELEEILNNSLNALQWMSATGSCLERKLRRLQRVETDPTHEAAHAQQI